MKLEIAPQKGSAGFELLGSLQVDAESQVWGKFSWVKEFGRISYGITNSVRTFQRGRK